MSSKLRPLCPLNSVHWRVPVPRSCETEKSKIPLSTTIVAQPRLECQGILYIIYFTDMARTKPLSPEDSKAEALRQHGALHPHPEAVRDEAFREHEFFDTRDSVQVKYEMLRRRRVDARAVREVAESFGVSRQAFYLAERGFQKEGLPGLLPRRRGPKGAHKCTDEVLAFVEQWQEKAPADQTLSEAIEERFGVKIHPRSIDRALARRKKKPPKKEQPQP